MKTKHLALASLITISTLSLGWTMAQEKAQNNISEPGTTEITSPFTKELIESYYKDADSVQTKDQETLKKWLHKHIHEDADIEMIVNLNIDEFNVKDRVQESFLDKYLLIQDNIDSYKIAKTEMVETTIESYKLSEDGQTATVELTNKSRSRSFGDEEKQKPELSITANGHCTDDLVINADIVQLLKRTCKLDTEATVTKP